MPWFSRKKATEENVHEQKATEQSVPEQNVPEPKATERNVAEGRNSVPLPDPGLPAHDPRQLVHGFLEGCGLSIMLMAPRPIEHVLGEAVRRAPVLANSSPLGSGIMRLNADVNTPWVAVETPSGSAVIVFGTPRSDSNLVMRNIMNPFGASTVPFAREVVASGSAEESVVTFLTGYEVVAVTEFPPFQHIAAANGHPILPISARRAARHWNRLAADLYMTTLADFEDATVCLTLMNGRVELMTPVGEGQAPAWTTPLLAAGTHRIENFDPTVFIATAAPTLSDGAELDAAARRLVSDVATAYKNARRSATPVAPEKSEQGDLWMRISRLPSGAVPSRPWSRPLRTPAFSLVERVRESLPDESSFESVDELARKLRQHRTTGFEHAWRGDGETLLSPDWLTVGSAVLDSETGRVVAGGHLTHGVWGLSPAHDLGAIDGRNAFTFSEAGHPGGLRWPTNAVYVGSVSSGVLVPLDATLNVIAVDLDGRDGFIAVLHHLGGGTAAVTLISATGERRLLTVLEGLAGNETIRFGNDGTWLLVSRSRDSLLVEVATGRWLTLDVANTCWWPGHGSTLLSIHHDDGRAYPTLFDLASNSYSGSFPIIELDVPLLESFPYIWNPAVSADGLEVLATSPAGVTADYQREHGAGSHLVRFTLATGRGTIVASPFLDEEQTLERDVSDVRWVQRPVGGGPVALHPDLVTQLQVPITTHEWLSPGRWADEAEQMLVLTLNVAVDATKQGGPVAHLLPEILAYLIPLASNPEAWARQAEWLVDLRDTTVKLVASGSLQGDLAGFWHQYGSAIAAIEAGRPDLIDAVEAGWKVAG